MVSGPNSQGDKLRRCDDKVKNNKIVCRTICEMAKKFFCKPRQLYWRGCVGGGGHNSYFSIVKTQFTFNTLSNHSRRRVDSFTFSFHEEEVEWRWWSMDGSPQVGLNCAVAYFIQKSRETDIDIKLAVSLFKPQQFSRSIDRQQ